jgi:hypothetical protein
VHSWQRALDSQQIQALALPASKQSFAPQNLQLVSTSRMGGAEHPSGHTRRGHS